MELYNLRVEHAVKSDVPGQWVGEIEQCTCPYGYEGLSCEVCHLVILTNDALCFTAKHFSCKYQFEGT
ncbi:unnamed protein product [Trichobilharzia regenti]|nr:unnamed protein product [Trichobilharzia regenti]